MAGFNPMAQQVKSVAKNVEQGWSSVRVLWLLPAYHTDTHSSIIISVKVGLVQQLWSRLELHLLLTIWLDSNRKYATNTSYRFIIHNQQVMLHLTLHNFSSIHSINK